MRQLGEQWIENGRMYKVVLHGLCDGCDFNMGCLQNGGVNCKAGHCVTKQGHVKDLGPVNEDGFLREERSGQYPDISHDKRNGVYEAYLHATLINPAMSAVLVRVQASSMDRLKEAWNRRV